MKNRNLLLLAVGGILLSSFAAFYPTGAPAGVTGSPGDGSNCSSCHGTAATTTTGWITSNIPVAGYTPGQSYQITATNNMTGSGQYGFEVSPQNNAGTLLGTLTAGTNSKLVGSGKYVTHSSSSSTIKSWTFSWVAPAAGTGIVTFYGAFARNFTGATTLSTLAVAEQSAALPAPAGPITGLTSVCVSSTTSYSVAPISGATSYVWFVPTGASITAGQGTNTITANYGVSAVSGNVSVYGTNSAGNGVASSLAITVNGIPAQPAAINGSAIPCQGSSQTYSVTSAAGVTYNWTVPSGSSIAAGQGTNTITVSIGANSGNVQVTPTNSCGNGTARNLAITISSAPLQPSAITGSAVSCEASTHIYSITNVIGITYTWIVPAGWVITAGQGTNSITATSGAAGGNIEVTPSNLCGSGTTRVLAVTVDPLSGISATPAGPNQVNLATILTSQFTTTGTSNATSYLWELTPPQAGSIIGTGLIATVTWNGVYLGIAEIRVRALNSCGDGAWSAKKSIDVINITGIVVRDSNHGMTVYPSPSYGDFTVALNGMSEKTELRVLDLTGKELYKTIIPGNEATKVERSLVPGIYFIQVKDNSITRTQKLIVR